MPSTTLTGRRIGSFRQRCLEQLRDALHDGQREELREQLILEVGCPRMLTFGPQLDAPLDGAISYPAKLIDEYPWETGNWRCRQHARGYRHSRRVVKEAVGVVGAIVPWNYPFEVSITKLAQALATGNTVVLKPAPDTPWNATLVGRLVAEHTDIPPGVLNVVTSSDHQVGEQLTLSSEVDLISFTGSTAVGKRIMEKGAATLKRLFLELGGKSATIVLDDADFPTAMMSGLAVCSHAGQGCAIPTRMLLPQSRYEEGVEILRRHVGVPYGDPQRADVIMGPLISEKQRSVLGYIQRGIDEGATLAFGGNQPKALDHRLVRGAHPLHECRQRNDNRPGRDIRPRAGRDPVRRRRRRREDRQRQQLWTRRGDLLGIPRAFPRRGDRVRTGILSVNGGMPMAPTCPLAATRTVGSVGRTGWRDSTSTSRPSHWLGRLADIDQPSAADQFATFSRYDNDSKHVSRRYA